MRKFLTIFTMCVCVIVGTAFLIGIAGSTSIADDAEGSAVRIKISDYETDVYVLEQDKNKVVVRMDVGSIELIPVSSVEGQFVLPRIEGFSRSFEVGEPTLPVASNLLSIPFDCELKVKVLDYETVDVDLEQYGIADPFMPVQPPLSKSQDPPARTFEYKREVYAAAGKYSLPLAKADVMGTLRALHMGKLAVSPVEYYANENRITVYKSVTVRVKYKNANWDKTEKMKEKHKSVYYDSMNQQMLNYEEAQTEADLVNYPVKYLVIADRMFESQLAPFIEWKTKKGFNVVTGYTDTIGSSTSAIKTYIEDLYNAGTAEDPAPSFVLFVGDVQQIPSWSGSAGSHITDLKYCEFTGDNYPEIYYGRFSAQNTTQLQPQIDKTLEYEQYTMPDPSYLGDVTLVSGVDSSYASTYGNGQINYGTNYYFNAAHGISPNVWLYPASDASGAAADIIQTISSGVGFYNYTAHCGHSGPSDPSFDTNDIDGLTNAHKYLLGIGNCCLSNTFGSDYSTPCFGEAWLQAEDKGGIGWIGGSNSTYWDEDYWWGVGNGPINGDGPTYEETGLGAYDGVFHDHGEPVSDHYTTNAAIMFVGNMAVTEAGSSRTQYYWEIYHLMGDPAVMTYMGVPSANNVSHPASVSPSATSVTVQADEGSYVGISRNGTLHGAGYIDSSGSASITIDPFGSSGTADIVVTCQNKVPYISTLTITSGIEPPTADFSGSPTSGYVPLTVTFTDQSIGAVSWSWDFGDTGTSTDQNPVHTYNSVGTYTVTLTAVNSYGSDVETKTNYITVQAVQTPTADFTASSTAIYTGQSVTFTDTSGNGPTSWSWTFDGGTPASSTDQDPVVTYNTAGTYTVSLTAANSAGSDTETKTDYITVTDQPLDYCDSQGNNWSYEYIGEVTIGSFTNTSGAAGYTDFTNLTIDLNADATYNVSLTPVFPSSTYTEYWKIWIDFNIDGDFEDAGEEVFSDVSSTTVTGTMTIPASASGLTRMRISMKWNAEPTPCETFSYGEVEDYTVNITAGTVDPPVADFHANTTIVTEGDSVNFFDDSTNNPTAWSWTFDGGTPSTSSDQNPTVTYNTAGTYTVELTATNSGGSDTETKTGYITVDPAGTSNLVIETGTVSNVGDGWQTVNLTNTYTSMVVVCSTDTGSGGLPTVTRVRNATGGSFDLRVQNPSGTATSGCTVHYVVVEEGVYTAANDGIKMEAKKAVASATAAYGSWTTEVRTYGNSYTNPVVVGQVMSYNDANWSVFWASASNYKDPPSSSALYAGKHVAEDTNKSRKSRNDETIGYIVMEQGSGTVNGIPYSAALGADTVRGPDNSSSGYTYTFGSVANASAAIISVAGMDGNNGGWPELWGTTPLTSTSLTMVFDEDQINDTERKHTTEQVAYIIFGE
jgi:PKD repeat protein